MVQLKAFRDGKRTDPTMAPMAAALTDQDIADLAAFYGRLKPAPAPAAAGAGDAAAGQTKSAACAACHGADGRGTTPLFPNLNGQKPEYLMAQLKAFRDGKRTDPTMAPMAMALTDQDIGDLAAFYGALK
jgi:cytochrome c553